MAERRLVFLSYSHKDAKWLDLLLEHLKPLAERKLLTWWSDADIKPGDEWRRQIQGALDDAKVAVLLVSPSFLASDFISKHELPRLLKAARAEELTILWVPISHSVFQHTEIAAYQSAHDPSSPLDGLRKAQRNQAIVKIAERILQIANADGRVSANETDLSATDGANPLPYDSPGALTIRPVLMIVYKKDGWHIQNKGRGPALNIVVAQKHVRGAERGSWFNPVRIPTLGPNEEQHLTWLGHENETGLGAGYEDEDGRPFTSVTGNDLTTVHRAKLFPDFSEQQIARHWQFFERPD